MTKTMGVQCRLTLLTLGHIAQSVVWS